MPIIVNSDQPHPSPTLLGSSGIDSRRASRQEIRPLDIVLFNFMKETQEAEEQIIRLLGRSPIQVKLTLAVPDQYLKDVRAGIRGKNEDKRDHLLKFYKPFSEVKDQRWDGAVFTGYNALGQTVKNESLHTPLVRMLRWAQGNATSKLLVCYAGKVWLDDVWNIPSKKGAEKLSGIFGHRLLSNKTGLADHLDDAFDMPVSRWKTPDRKAIWDNAALEVVAESEETGPSVIVEPATYHNGAKEVFYPRTVVLLGHPEYDADTLKREYERDTLKALEDKKAPPAMPKHYFPGGDATQVPANTWRSGTIIFRNWVDKLYAATPYDQAQIPRPYSAQATGSSLALINE